MLEINARKVKALLIKLDQEESAQHEDDGDEDEEEE